jgi:phosphoribosylamine--glycine ligase
MKVGIIGSGGREDAICQTLSKSNKVDEIFCFPGNAGTAKIAQNISINLEDFDRLKDYINLNKIDLVVVGPEKPLVEGVVDFLEKNNIKVFGPNKIASQLEGSKIFTKNLCKKYNIPTAEYGIFQNISSATKFIENKIYPLVIKADGLAAGKGVYICADKETAKLAIKEIFEGKFGEAKNLLIEEFLEGEEMSYFTINDGNNFKHFGSAQDHKRVMEGDKGKNTGGMGAYSPSRLMSTELEKKIIDRIINPTLKALTELGTEYKGFLYAGLMIVNNNPYLIEYNVRMGDPECQTILPKLETDLLDIFLACCEKKLDKINIKWSNMNSLCVVMCSNGYPDIFKKNIEIKNLEKIKLNKHEYIFHAGTLKKNNTVYAIGGRVLNFVALSDEFNTARQIIYKKLDELGWQGGFYRKDIGYKVIK